MRLLTILILFLSLVLTAQTQKPDKGYMEKHNSEFHDNMMKTLTGKERSRNVKKKLKAALDNFRVPESLEEFNTVWHTPPVCQGRSGMCWSFSTISFLESEVKRLHDKEIKLSELYTVYWEYVEKAGRYIKAKGESRFSEGSLSGAVINIWRKYGAVPLEVFDGKKEKFYNHSELFGKLNTLLKNVKSKNAWNADSVITEVKQILNNYIGEMPETFTFDDTEYTPKSFLTDYLKVNPEDYTVIVSQKDKPFYQYVKYEVPDNWWQGEEYYNVPLNEYMKYLKESIKNGYSMSIDMDFTETGYDFYEDAAVIPSYDIPSGYINDDARFLRFSNNATTDDHLVHIIGIKEDTKGDWYLIKDSWSWAFDGDFKGYFFLHEDYVKLKVLFYVTHKDIADKLRKKADG